MQQKGAHATGACKKEEEKKSRRTSAPSSATAFQLPITKIGFLGYSPQGNSLIFSRCRYMLCLLKRAHFRSEKLQEEDNFSNDLFTCKFYFTTSVCLPRISCFSFLCYRAKCSTASTQTGVVCITELKY